MIILISAIILLGIVTYYFHRLDLKKQVEKTNKIVQTKIQECKGRTHRRFRHAEIQEPPQECCGRHLVCERDSLLAGVSKTIEYYDDEELDAWKGIEPDSYTPEQIELFREIFYTLRPEDVPGWVRSLQLRQIAVPESLRDEILLVVNEQRTIDK